MMTYTHNLGIQTLVLNCLSTTPPEYSQALEDFEYLPTTDPPEHNHPPAKYRKTVGGAQWNRPLNQIKITKFIQM